MIEIWKSKFSWRFVLDKQAIIECNIFRNHKNEIGRHGTVTDYNKDLNNAFYLNDEALGYFLIHSKEWQIGYIWRVK